MTAADWRAVPQFALWTAAGASAALGVLTAPSIGLFVLPATIAAAAMLIRWGRTRLTGPGILTGAGLPLIYVAYLNRGGPGTVCTTTATSQSGIQETSPWPWLAAAVCLAVAGAALLIWTTHHRPG